MSYPNPELFESWQDWARSLILSLQARSGEHVITLQHEVSTDLPSAAVPGVLIYVKDTQQVMVSDGTQWLAL